LAFQCYIGTFVSIESVGCVEEYMCAGVDFSYNSYEWAFFIS